MGLRVANRPLLDAQNRATGVVVRAGFGKGSKTIRNGRDDIDSIEFERFELEMVVDGTSAPISMTIYAGSVLNGVIDSVGRGKAQRNIYNKLTSIALGLEIVAPVEVEGVIGEEVMRRVETALLGLEGTKVTFRLGKVEGKNLLIPVPDSLRLAE
jgi:hypothetical protein